MGDLNIKIAAGLLATGIASFVGGVGSSIYHTREYCDRWSPAEMTVEMIQECDDHMQKAMLGELAGCFSSVPLAGAYILSSRIKKNLAKDKK